MLDLEGDVSALPFLGSGMIMDGVHYLGHSFVLQILWHNVVWTSIISGPPCLSSYVRILSVPVYLSPFSVPNASSREY